eukprot:TRINITY_DN595_c0_g1_i1.p2 TRINITY_DN595_c0_g1~~TRINITY_DN595_c0_g1_i1.p2  ORF type:complete len:200 (+),score=47.16 TRINITY_DN595_c0_g1_i1:961-1560(+)
MVHVNVSAQNTSRLVMRADGILKLLMNVPIFAAMSCERVQDKSVRIGAHEDEKVVNYLLRVSRKEEATQLQAAIERCKKAALDGSEVLITETPQPLTFSSTSITTTTTSPAPVETPASTQEPEQENKHNNTEQTTDGNQPSTSTVSTTTLSTNTASPTAKNKTTQEEATAPNDPDKDQKHMTPTAQLIAKSLAEEEERI